MQRRGFLVAAVGMTVGAGAVAGCSTRTRAMVAWGSSEWGAGAWGGQEHS